MDYEDDGDAGDDVSSMDARWKQSEGRYEILLRDHRGVPRLERSPVARRRDSEAEGERERGRGQLFPF